jgi:CRP-like cAMP-binding protein
MAASVVKLRTKADLLQAEQADRLRQLVIAFPELPPRAVGEIVAAIDRQTASANQWAFVMLSPDQNRAVVKWLTAHSQRPMVAVQVWAELFSHLRRDTGEVMLTRDELADAIGVHPNHISEIMGELEGIGAISRKRTKVAGMRGRGTVAYFMSARVGTHLSGAARDKAQADAPQLRLVE